ncbi:hypothetical protein B7494_g1315 [Chlorociboria aeruginascens]|nr:hypothetical protein B7494_g1315 [Chlorociboria aeruginascens]
MNTVKNLVSHDRAQGQTSNQNARNIGVLSGEGSHLANARDTTRIPSGLTGSNAGQISGLADPGITGTGQQETLQNDVTMGGAGGIHPTERENLGAANTGYTGNDATGSPHYYSGPAGTGVGGSRNSGTTNRLDPIMHNSGNTGTQHHLGNEEAVGGMGSDIYGERGNLGSSTGYAGNTPTGVGSHFSGPRGTGISGPHSTDTANRLDPSVNTSAAGTEHSGLHTSGHGAVDKHYAGRDAAIGVGGAGFADHEHNKLRNEHEAGLAGPASTENSAIGIQHNTTGTSHFGRDATVGAGTVGFAGHEHKKHENERHNEGTTRLPRASGYSPLGTHDHAQDHHTRRDATIGAGGVDLVENEHNKDQQDSTYLPGPAPNTAGPHKRDWMNKLDPRVNAHPDVPQTTGHGPLKVDAAKVPQTRYPENTHHGRDAAAVGGIGGTAYEADKPHNTHGTGAVGQTGHITGGSQSSEISNMTDPVANRDGSKDHHYGRDAATVGMFGGTAHEVNKHHNVNEPGALGTTPQSTTPGPQSPNMANKANPIVESGRSNDHHHGRDAAAAGGIGGGAYEADKHHKHEKEEKPKGGLLSFFHRDKNKKYTPEEEAEFGRQEREHHATNTGSRVQGAGHSSFGVSGATVGAPSGTPTNTFTGIADDGHAGSHSHPDRYLGRDTVAEVGGIRLAEHEHRKNEAVGQHNTTSNTASGIPSHTLGSPGGETGYRTDNTTIGSNTEYPHNTASNTNTADINNPTIGDDRNRLHKDPPPGHVAHVPATRAESEVRGGEQGLGDDTGIVKPHEQVGSGTGLNATSNY